MASDAAAAAAATATAALASHGEGEDAVFLSSWPATLAATLVVLDARDLFLLCFAIVMMGWRNGQYRRRPPRSIGAGSDKEE